MNNRFNDFDKIKASDNLKSKIIKNIILEKKSKASITYEQEPFIIVDNNHNQKISYENISLKERINNILNQFKEKTKKRFSPVAFTFMLIILSSTLVYALSNIDFFKTYFGKSIYLVQDEIFSVVSSVSNEDYKLTVEGVLSDEYKNVAVVSCEALSEDTKKDFEEYEQNFIIEKGKNITQSSSYQINELEQLSSKIKKYYLIDYISKDEKIDSPLLLYLDKELSDLFVEIPIATTLQTKEISIDQSYYTNSDYAPQSVVISPLSVIITGYEKIVNYQIPNPELTILFKDNTEMYICGDKLSDFELRGARFPEDNLTIVSFDFEQIINLEMIEKVFVDGVEYVIE